MASQTLRTALRAGFVITGTTLLALVAAVGGVALFAELNGTWGWYRLMEKVIAAAAAPALALTGIMVVTMAGVALAADS